SQNIIKTYNALGYTPEGSTSDANRKLDRMKQVFIDYREEILNARRAELSTDYKVLLEHALRNTLEQRHNLSTSVASVIIEDMKKQESFFTLSSTVKLRTGQRPTGTAR